MNFAVVFARFLRLRRLHAVEHDLLRRIERARQIQADSFVQLELKRLELVRQAITRTERAATWADLRAAERGPVVHLPQR